MKDAESTPSPSKFCKIFGMRNPALNASAAAELPRKCAKMLSRMMPAMRLSRIPDATTLAAPPGGRSFASSLDVAREESTDYADYVDSHIRETRGQRWHGAC